MVPPAKGVVATWMPKAVIAGDQVPIQLGLTQNPEQMWRQLVHFPLSECAVQCSRVGATPVAWADEEGVEDCDPEPAPPEIQN